MKKIYAVLSLAVACGLVHITTDNVIVLGAANALFLFSLGTVSVAALVRQPAPARVVVRRKSN